MSVTGDQHNIKVIEVRRRRRKRNLRDDDYYIARDARFGRRFALLMLVLVLAYAMAVGVNLYRLVRASGSLWLGMSQQDLRYQLGDPPHITGASWAYAQKGRMIVASFDAQGSLARVSCSQLPNPDDFCPPVGEIGIGSSEADVTNFLGQPDATSYVGTTKLLDYSRIGYGFELEKSIVHKITHDKIASWTPLVRQYLLLAIP